MDPSTTGKRRKLSLFHTMRVCNGGASPSHITPFDTPLADIDPGSDTENEDDEETAQFYLNKMADDTNRPKETVFGEGVEVWKSHGGTIYADLTDKVKRKMREEELWGQEAREKVEGGLKRKVGEEQEEKIEIWKAKDEGGKIPVDPLPMPLAPSTPPTEAYPERDPRTTQFHHSSAGIDPFGAHNRPIKPLPKRRAKMGQRIAALGVGVGGTSSNRETTLKAHLLTGCQAPLSLPQVLGDPQLPPLIPPIQSTPLSEAVRPNRIVSGSFGSFDGVPSRFDERAYRLLPKTSVAKKTGDVKEASKKVKKADGKPDLFKSKPWLQR